MVSLTSLLVPALQGAVFLLLVLAVRRRNAAAAVNALVAFVLAVLPSVAGAYVGPEQTPSVVLPLWLATAGVLHSMGMLGLYESVWWWDHLTHTVSGGLVAALVYAGILVTRPTLGGIVGDIGGPLSSPRALTVGFSFAIGVFWELIELVAREVGEWFDVEPVLVHYGWRDTALDLVFDVVAAVLVIALDLRVFVGSAERFPAATETLLVGAVWTVFVGSVVMAVFVGFRTKVRT
ncbi:hypothetical protein [Halostella litorea]|uniref:hypothetical protein n=1 Tax=Halostella litorea TaxID=2528831 RepID=UPI0010929CBB|nr:hypothetical protein [Halostella litorea]